MSKARPKTRPEENNDPTTKTKYSTAHKNNPDYEHAGVAIAIHKKWVHLVEEVREISGRTMTVILNTGGGKLALIATYAPTADKAENTKNKYWD